MSDAGLASHTGLTPSGSYTFVAHYGDDNGMRAVFSYDAVYKEFESKGGELITGTVKNPVIELMPGKGRPVYENKVFVYLERPGSKSNTIREVPMDDDGKPLPGDGSFPTFPERFPKQWQQFLNKEEQTHSGTPLEMWPGLTKAQVLELKGAKIHTVEQLGSLPDSTLQNIGMMDARALRDKAKAYMDKAEDGAALSSAMQMIEQQRIDMDMLRAQMAILSEERTETKRGPGRPPKDKTDAD